MSRSIAGARTLPEVRGGRCSDELPVAVYDAVLTHRQRDSSARGGDLAAAGD